MSLVDLIPQTNLRLCARVRVGGYTFAPTSISIEAGYDQIAATATVITPRVYDIEAGMNTQHIIEIEQGYNGYYNRTFYGYVDSVDPETFPGRQVIKCRDVLKRALETFITDKLEYRNTRAEDIVKQVLKDHAGLTDLDIESTGFTMGIQRPAEFQLQSVMDVVKHIADLLGYRVWATPDGVVHFRQVAVRPSSSSFWDYVESPNKAAGNSGIVRARAVRSDKALRNRIVVRGQDADYNLIEVEAKADSPYVPTPPRYRSAVISSSVLDNADQCQQIADRVLNELNRISTTVDLEVVGNPLLQVGHTIGLQESFTGHASTTKYFLYQLRSTMDETGYRMNLTLLTGTGATYHSCRSPAASFNLKQVAWGDPTIVVYVDASASNPVASPTITQYRWDWGDGNTETRSGPYACHRYTLPQGSSVTITLTVTNGCGSTGSMSKTITLGEGEYLYNRVIYVVGNNGSVWSSPDSGVTWYHSSLPYAAHCLAVNQADKHPIVLVGAASVLYKSTNYARSFGQIGTWPLSGNLTAAFIDQLNNDRWLIGFSGGNIMLTEDAGASWTLLTTAPGQVTYLLIDPSNSLHFVAAGQGTTGWLWESYDGGTTWANKATWDTPVGDVNDAAWQRLTELWVGGSGGAARIKRSQDMGATWAEGDAGIDVKSISASPSETKAVVCTTSNSNVYAGSGPNMTYRGSFSHGGSGRKIRYEPDMFDTIVAGTSNNLEISFDDGATWKEFLNTGGEQVNDVNWGPLVVPVVEPVVWFSANDLAYGQTIAYRKDQGWTNVTAAWKAHGGTGLVGRASACHATGKQGIVIVPASTGGQHGAIWRSTDWGQTWTQVYTKPEWTPYQEHHYETLAMNVSAWSPVEPGTCFVLGWTRLAYDVSKYKLENLENYCTVLVSTDYGVTWGEFTIHAGWMGSTTVNHMANAIDLHVAADGKVFVSGVTNVALGWAASTSPVSGATDGASLMAAYCADGKAAPFAGFAKMTTDTYAVLSHSDRALGIQLLEHVGHTCRGYLIWGEDKYLSLSNWKAAVGINDKFYAVRSVTTGGQTSFKLYVFEYHLQEGGWWGYAEIGELTEIVSHLEDGGNSAASFSRPEFACIGRDHGIYYTDDGGENWYDDDHGFNGLGTNWVVYVSISG